MDNELKFIVNKEKRTVTCIATDCEYDVINDLSNILSVYPSNVKYLFLKDLTNTDDLIINSKFIATAKCSPMDVWDEEYGKKLAIKKMRFKYNKAKLKVIHKYWDKFDIAMGIVDNLSDWYENKTFDAESHLRNCLEEKEN